MFQRLRNWFADRKARREYSYFQRGYDYATQGLRAGTPISQLEAEADVSSTFNESATAQAFDRGMRAALKDHEDARRRFRELREQGLTPTGRSIRQIEQDRLNRSMQNVAMTARVGTLSQLIADRERRDVPVAWPSGIEASNDIPPRTGS